MGFKVSESVRNEVRLTYLEEIETLIKKHSHKDLKSVYIPFGQNIHQAWSLNSKIMKIMLTLYNTSLYLLLVIRESRIERLNFSLKLEVSVY